MMGTKGEEMRRFLLSRSRSTHTVAVESDGFIGGGDQGGCRPGAQNLFQGRRIQLRKQPAVLCIAGSQEGARTKHLAQEVLVLGTPLTYGFAALTLTEQSSNQTGQQKGQIVAEAMASTRIRKRF